MGQEVGGCQKKSDGAGGSDVDTVDYFIDLKRYCLGFMGMESGEYYNTLYPDLLLKIEGCRQRLKREEAMFRKVGFSAYIGSHLDPKGMAKSEGRYWPIDEEDGKKGVVDLEGKKEAFMELLKEVQNNKSPK